MFKNHFSNVIFTFFNDNSPFRSCYIMKKPRDEISKWIQSTEKHCPNFNKKRKDALVTRLLCESGTSEQLKRNLLMLLTLLCLLPKSTLNDITNCKNMSGFRTTKHFESQRSNHKMIFFSVALMAFLKAVKQGWRTRQLLFRVSKITWAEDVLIYVILLNFNMPLSADYSTCEIKVLCGQIAIIQAGNFEKWEERSHNSSQKFWKRGREGKGRERLN